MLLGFALVVQTLGYLVVTVAVLAVAWASFIRLDTLAPGTEEFDTVMAGSIGITAVTGIVLGLAAGALGVLVQGIVIIEVTHAAVAEKLSLGALWRQLRPVAWRLVGYALLLSLAVITLVILVGVALFAIGTASVPVAVGLTVLVFLSAVPLALWLTTKLLLAPAAIIIEHATIGAAVVRAWTLIRGRFWPALGILVVISVTFGVVAQVISVPFSLFTSSITTIVAPTGDPEPSLVIGLLVTGLLTQVVTLLVQSVAVVVQSTATALIYIDCRMRREGLDLDLLGYIDQRDAGVTALADPYRAHVGRAVAPRPVAPSPYPAAGAYPYAGAPYPGAPHPGGEYPAAPYPAAPYPAAPYPAAAPQPHAVADRPAAPPPGRQPADAPAAAPPAEPADGGSAPTTWTAPGASPSDSDRQSPWS